MKAYFALGLSKRGQFPEEYSNWEDTFYGFGANQFWILNGDEMLHDNSTGTYGEKLLNKKFNTDHFKVCGDTLIDIYYDHNKKGGLLKMKRVEYNESNAEELEVRIIGINACVENSENEWIPHFVFSNTQTVSFASIHESMYGVEFEIDWEVST